MEIAMMGSIQSSLGAPGGNTLPTLREATEQFESLFVAQVMKAMRSTVPESHLMGSGSGQQIFREMLDRELAGQIAHAGGFGIGEMLYQQITQKERQDVRTPISDGEAGVSLGPRNDTRSQSTTEGSKSQNHED